MKRLFNALFFLLLILLPTQLGFHFWPSQTLVLGRRIDYLSPTVYVTDVVVWLLVISAVFQKRLRQRFPKKAAILFLLGAGLYVLTTTYQNLTAYALYKIAEFGFLVWLVTLRKPKWQDIFYPLVLGSTFAVFLALNQWFTQHSLGGWWYFFGERSFSTETPGIAQMIVMGRLFLRPYGTFPHPNVLAGFLAVLFPWWLGLQPKSKIERIFCVTALAVTGLGIFLSFSRVAWAAICIMVAWFIFKRTRLSTLLFAPIIVLVEELTLGRFAAVWQTEQESIIFRQKLAAAAIALFQKNPLFGSGPLNFISVLPRVSTPPFLLQPVHNIVLLIVAETGMLGLLLAAVIFFKAYLSRGLYYPLVRMSLATIFFLGLFDHYFLTLQQTQLLFSLILGLALI